MFTTECNTEQCTVHSNDVCSVLSSVYSGAISCKYTAHCMYEYTYIVQGSMAHCLCEHVVHRSLYEYTVYQYRAHCVMSILCVNTWLIYVSMLYVSTWLIV